MSDLPPSWRIDLDNETTTTASTGNGNETATYWDRYEYGDDWYIDWRLPAERMPGGWLARFGRWLARVLGLVRDNG